MKQYWLYIETYALLLYHQNFVVIYNTLQSKGYKIPNSEKLNVLIGQLLKPENSYCVTVTEEQLEEVECQRFVGLLRKTYCGDLLDKAAVSVKPVIFGACLDLQKERAREGFADHILNYLSEINIYLNSKITEPQFCSYKSGSEIEGEDIFPEDISRLLNQLQAAPVKMIHLWGLPESKERLAGCLKLLQGYSVKKEWYVTVAEARELSQEQEIMAEFEVKLNVLCVIGDSDCHHLEELKECFKARMLFYIASVEDYQLAEQVIQTLRITDYKILPLYTGNNLVFFKENIFLEEKDILNSTVRRRDYFAHQLLNTYDFGKLSLFPHGDIRVTPYSPKIGNIHEMDIRDILYQEIVEGKSWLNIRDKGKCKGCIYQWLCPSPSVFERVIGHYDLCHI